MRCGVVLCGAALAAVCVSAAQADAGVASDVAAGDRAWEARAEGVDERGRARPEPIGRAIAAYERAVAAAPVAGSSSIPMAGANIRER